MVSSGSAAPGLGGYINSPGRQGLGFSGVAVPSGEPATSTISSGVRAAARAVAIPEASDGGAMRRATGDGAPEADERRRHTLGLMATTVA
jgi:hypothetical protein